MSKYVRHSSVISRQADESIEEDHWLKRFEKSLLKDAVQPVRQQSLFDQITDIMNNKSRSKHSTVEGVVQEMQERSGLIAYLDKINKTSTDDGSSAKTVTASDNQSAFDKKVDMTPIVIKKKPEILKTFRNFIEDSKGNLPISAIIDKVKGIHRNDCSDAKDWDDDNLIVLVSRLNLEAKKNNPSNFQNDSNLGRRDLGASDDIDPSNTDAFFALTPAKI